MEPIASRDERELLAKIEAAYGQATADLVAVAMLPRAIADAERSRERLDELVSEFPQLKSARPRPGAGDS